MHCTWHLCGKSKILKYNFKKTIDIFIIVLTNSFNSCFAIIAKFEKNAGDTPPNNYEFYVSLARGHFKHLPTEPVQCADFSLSSLSTIPVICEAFVRIIFGKFSSFATLFVNRGINNAIANVFKKIRIQ